MGCRFCFLLQVSAIVYRYTQGSTHSSALKQCCHAIYINKCKQTRQHFCMNILHMHARTHASVPGYSGRYFFLLQIMTSLIMTFLTFLHLQYTPPAGLEHKLGLGVALLKAALCFNASAPEYLNGGVMQHNFQSSWTFRILAKLTLDSYYFVDLPMELTHMTRFCKVWENYFLTKDLWYVFLFGWVVVPLCHQSYPGPFQLCRAGAPNRWAPKRSDNTAGSLLHQRWAQNITLYEPHQSSKKPVVKLVCTLKDIRVKLKN